MAIDRREGGAWKGEQEKIGGAMGREPIVDLFEFAPRANMAK
jgi:hypothetical protein